MLQNERNVRLKRRLGKQVFSRVRKARGERKGWKKGAVLEDGGGLMPSELPPTDSGGQSVHCRSVSHFWLRSVPLLARLPGCTYSLQDNRRMHAFLQVHTSPFGIDAQVQKRSLIRLSSFLPKLHEDWALA